MAPPRGRWQALPSTLPVILGLLLLFSATASAASVVLGIDFGTEYIKAALVKPGKPLEVVLTKDSKRKEISALAFKTPKTPKTGIFPERSYGGDALALSARFPGDVYPNLKALLGIPFKDQYIVEEYTKRHPALQLVVSKDKPTVSFKSNSFLEDEDAFMVEELLAMELQNIRENAKALAGKGNHVSEAIITIPAFYTADEKRALEVAAELAGIKVLGLITDGLAVGIHYATSRTFPVVNDGAAKPEYHMVFDMGAGSTTATILKFQGRSVKDVGRFNKDIQEVQVVGVGWDRTLGGDYLNGLIVDHIVDEFSASPAATKASISAEAVKKHGRTTSRLLKEAEKVRQVLSANTKTSAFFESLYNDVDFRYKLTREQFEEMATGFAARVEGPVIQALKSAGMTFADINSVILHGGAVRTPLIQKKLESLAGGAAKLRSNVNSDEAAVLGAAFKAATMSPSFRVKDIRDRDTLGYDMGVQYMWNLKDRLQKVFSSTSQTGVVKEIPFKMMGEFSFTLYQTVPSGGENLVNSPVLEVRTGNMTRVVHELINTEGCDREEINTKCSIKLDPFDGIPEVLGCLVTCEIEEKKPSVVEDVKEFFGFGSKKDDQQPIKDDEGADASSQSSASSQTSSAASSASASSKGSKSTSAAAGSDDKSDKPTKKTISSAVTLHFTVKGYEKLRKPELKRIKERLAGFDESDRARRAREEVYNSLEAFTYRARDLLEDEGFMAVSNTEQRSKIEELLRATSDWLHDDGESAPEETLRGKLKELTNLVKPIEKRKEEVNKRPELVKVLQDSLESTKGMVQIIKEHIAQAEASASSLSAEAAKSSTSSTTESVASSDPLADLEEEATSSSSSEAPIPTLEPPMYTPEDLNVIQGAYDIAQNWLTEKLAAQEKLASHEDPAFLTTELTAKTNELNKVVQDLVMKKFRIPPKNNSKPKSKSKSKTKSKTKSAKKAKSTATAEKEKKPENVIEVPPGASMEEIQEAIEKAKAKASPKTKDEL